MNETQRNQIKGALLKCAEENENRPIFTGYVVVSSVCKSAVERIEELEKHNADLERKLEQTEKDLTDYQFNYPKIKDLEKENAELKEQVSFLKDNLRVARKDREDLQLDVAKGLKEFVKDYPATALRYLANEKYVEQLTKAKEIIRWFVVYEKGEGIITNYNNFLEQAENILKE